MVNIHHQHPLKQVDDQAALAVFQQQWQTYQKLVDGNYLSHREAYGILHQVLVGNFAHRPFNFLELACGDAGSTAEALQGTTIQHYHGLDLSEPALEMARRNLENCPVRWIWRKGTLSPPCEAGPKRRMWCGWASLCIILIRPARGN